MLISKGLGQTLQNRCFFENKPPLHTAYSTTVKSEGHKDFVVDPYYYKVMDLNYKRKTFKGYNLAIIA